MKILLVEDNKAFADAVIASLSGGTGVNIRHVVSRDSSLEFLKSEFFDLIILDLAIPAVDGGLDVAPEYGQEVFHQARTISSGTPILFLTGSEPDSFTMRLARLGEQIDLWGGGKKTSTIDYRRKEEVDLLVADVLEYASEICITNSIELDTRGKDLNFSEEEARMLKVFTRMRGGVSSLIQKLGGGLSDARVFRVTVRDDKGFIKIICVAKVGIIGDVETECSAYEQHVASLKMGGFTPLIKYFDKGLRGYAGIFYSLADGYDRTLFDVVAKSPDIAAGVVNQLKECVGRWVDTRVLRSVKIEEIRRCVLSDADYQNLKIKNDLVFLNGLEDLYVNAYFSPTHGDLHAGNVLVNNNDSPVLIDFGDVDSKCSCLDPVTLELSLMFHPDAKAAGIFEMLSRRITDWPNIDIYKENNVLAAFIGACRDWAHDVGGSDKAVLAAGYSFSLRQLKYDTVPAQLTLSILLAISKKLMSK